jgi:hypothetical protein
VRLLIGAPRGLRRLVHIDALNVHRVRLDALGLGMLFANVLFGRSKARLIPAAVAILYAPKIDATGHVGSYLQYRCNTIESEAQKHP